MKPIGKRERNLERIALRHGLTFYIEDLRLKALSGKLLGVLQHFRTEKRDRKPRRRKVLTRYQRVIKNFL